MLGISGAYVCVYGVLALGSCRVLSVQNRDMGLLVLGQVNRWLHPRRLGGDQWKIMALCAKRCLEELSGQPAPTKKTKLERDKRGFGSNSDWQHGAGAIPCMASTSTGYSETIAWPNISI